jgi:SRSO17 transposase
MSEGRQERFAAYVEALAEVIGHADRAAPLRDYCRGLLLPGEGKSVEPIAAPLPASPTVGFLSKPEIALEQIRAACAAGLPHGVVLMDAGYGSNTWLREEIGALG